MDAKRKISFDPKLCLVLVYVYKGDGPAEKPSDAFHNEIWIRRNPQSC